MALKKGRGSNKSKGLCKLAIDQEMTIYSISALKQGLAEEIDMYDRFELNLSGVEEFDSAGIQLLLALRRELMDKQKELQLSAVSGVVSKLIERYSVSERFNMGSAS